MLLGHVSGSFGVTRCATIPLGPNIESIFYLVLGLPSLREDLTMNISASLTNRFKSHTVKLETNGNSKTIQIAPKNSGFGSSVNGGELLLLSIATCFCNDIYREAAKRSLSIRGVEVEVMCEFGADGEMGKNFQYTCKIDSDEDKTLINDLVQHTDRIAEIHNTLRNGVQVVLNATKP